ncbi:MAG TPA: HD domain-containing phosphohydrolase [Terriglobia bacterium]|nr:HD domain-containing phosphohydrolase [Terriglobia bacterium]
MNQEQRKYRILVVDDEPPMREMLMEFLSLKGFECQGCPNGDEALALLKHESFDGLISDLRMPGISGLTLLDEAHKSYPRLALLMATADSEIQNGIKAMKVGADDYLLKPFQLEAVLASVQRALDKKAMESELESYRRNLEDMVEQRTKQLRTAMKRIELSYDETLEALGAALDLRDSETEGHSRRVSLYCLEMAQKMGCPNEQLRQIARGSYLHDIGKIGIPDSILLKPSKLTSEETSVMRTHARIGYDLVCRIGFLAPAAEIVLTHHERFDGTGYPQGLVGEEIPLGARIFAVADTLDAMTSDRSYRNALPFSDASAEIARESGRQFDPEVVKVFLSIPELVWKGIRRQVAGMRALPAEIPSETSWAAQESGDTADTQEPGLATHGSWTN